eukprot:CAMPEP_0174308096 /NCGR_PEP_ID=MMETSP0810-20121108/1530_1 /TAXON_ID=73025 ORGANISM="Eutreptiella gymnastica-like, Strain CCMP1594" /NCGR_SAMPLE_ID=MMETSP0810 /ASSEMBLY_ACC=CAM_ASM_000659 /LENGTH=53 /DNA_ID=CAMNT_0015415311 /DNA_START=1561 /DNA_END=1719 /DNA_ORIENTATION=-
MSAVLPRPRLTLWHLPRSPEICHPVLCTAVPVQISGAAAQVMTLTHSADPLLM